MNSEAKSKITNIDRIMRIIMRMCDGGMQALIRTKRETKVGIRGFFARVETISNQSFLRFEGISGFGLEKIKERENIKIEVIGMPSQVTFVTKVLSKNKSGITCQVPSSLLNHERRNNVRISTTNSKMAYIKLSGWEPHVKDWTTSPAFQQFRHLSSWLPVLDISIGGLCVKTHFPAVLNHLTSYDADERSQLILPMTLPLTIPIKIKWQRRIKNRLNDLSGDRYQNDFRFGVEFAELSEDHLIKIKQYMRQLQVAEAI